MNKPDQHAKFMYDIKRTFYIFLISGLIMLVFLFLWHTYRNNLYNFFGLNADGSSANELGSTLVIFMQASLYGTFQAFILNRNMLQNKRMKSAVDTLDARTFLEERDRRTSHLIHALMLIISMITIGFECLYPYSTPRVGMFVLGGSTFLASLAFFVALELENPLRGVGRINPKKIPQGWMTMTIYDIMNNKVIHFQNPCILCSKEKSEEKNIVESFS